MTFHCGYCSFESPKLTPLIQHYEAVEQPRLNVQRLVEEMERTTKFLRSIR